MKSNKVKKKTPEELKPDRELLLWEKWIQIRNEEAAKICKKVKRPEIDLAMNLGYKVRKEREEKTVLEYAQIEEKPNLRGGLWEQPARLHQKCEYEPIYEIQRTSAEVGHPPVINYVGVPQQIQEEEKNMKGVPEKNKCEKLNADYRKYKEMRETKLKDKLKKVDPYRPKIESLLVVGKKPKPPPPKKPNIPSITMTTSTSFPDNFANICAVRINNTVLYKDIPEQCVYHFTNMHKQNWHEDRTSWGYYFNTPANIAGRSTLILENLGTVSLRYCWKKVKKTIPFIPDDYYEQVYFFNKNENVLYPGQTTRIHFTFLSPKPGVFSECWELNFCNFFFFDALGQKLSIHLNADATENIDEIHKQINLLKQDIQNQVLINYIRKFLQEIVMKATEIQPLKYPYKDRLLESDYFVMKNPVCFYHQTEVLKMKELYTEMVQEVPWDLSISSWRTTMMSKDFEERMKYYDLLKESHSELLKPWYEGEDLLHHKYRITKHLLSRLADKIDDEYDRLRKFWIHDSNLTLSSKVPIGAGTLDSVASEKMRNVFYIHVYNNFVGTIETCAGILDSLDLNRRIEFDFCRM